jgi:hypothetical protein
MQEMAPMDTSTINRAEKLWDRKPDSPEFQTGPSSFPGGSDSTWSPAGVEGTQGASC